MKIVSLLFVLFLSLSLKASVPNVDDKILEVFAHTYPDVRGVQWSQSSSHWEAYFQDNGIINKLQYSNAGELVRATRYYQAGHLNPELLVKLHRKYKQHRIFGVTEVTAEGNTRYHVVLEDGKSWYHVEANAFGDIQLRSKYRKA